VQLARAPALPPLRPSLLSAWPLSPPFPDRALLFFPAFGVLAITRYQLLRHIGGTLSSAAVLRDLTSNSDRRGTSLQKNITFDTLSGASFSTIPPDSPAPRLECRLDHVDPLQSPCGYGSASTVSTLPVLPRIAPGNTITMSLRLFQRADAITAPRASEIIFQERWLWLAGHRPKIRVPIGSCLSSTVPPNDCRTLCSFRQNGQLPAVPHDHCFATSPFLLWHQEFASLTETTITSTDRPFIFVWSRPST